MSLPESPDALSEDVIMAYLEKFLDISDFKRIDNGKDLLDIVRKHPDHPRIKVVVRKVIGLFLCETPSAKVCALQFLKEAMEGNSWSVVEGVEKSVLASFAEIVEYRGSIPSLQRGSTYFLRSVPKNATDDEVMNLLKLSSTFFRMVHECVYVWGALYFPNSPFDRLRAKLAKRFVFPKFPQEFKFFNERKTDQFKANCREMVERMAQKVSTMVETASVLSRKSSSSVSKKKEERKDANSSEKTISAINVKEAFEQYAKGKSLKMTHIEHEELERDRGEKGKASLERGKASEKKGSKKEEKSQKRIHEPEM